MFVIESDATIVVPLMLRRCWSARGPGGRPRPDWPRPAKNRRAGRSRPVLLQPGQVLRLHAHLPQATVRRDRLAVKIAPRVGTEIERARQAQVLLPHRRIVVRMVGLHTHDAARLQPLEVAALSNTSALARRRPAAGGVRRAPPARRRAGRARRRRRRRRRPAAGGPVAAGRQAGRQRRRRAAPGQPLNWPLACASRRAGPGRPRARQQRRAAAAATIEPAAGSGRG